MGIVGFFGLSTIPRADRCEKICSQGCRAWAKLPILPLDDVCEELGRADHR